MRRAYALARSWGARRHRGRWRLAYDTRGWVVIFREEDVIDFLAAEMLDEAGRQGKALVGEEGLSWTLSLNQMRQVIWVALQSTSVEDALIEIVANTNWPDD